MRCWEDFAVGETTELGTIEVTRDEIVEFAQRNDPQPFHVDKAARAEGPYGGLIASGWHTVALFLGLFGQQKGSKPSKSCLRNLAQ